MAGAGFRHVARMEHRVSLITLAATDPQALAKFYASLGWRQVDETPKIVVFDLLGQALGLYERAALAEETGVPAAASGSTVLSHNVESKQLVDDLMARGLVQDSTDQDALRSRLEEGPITVYCGFDPTADSLHIGHLVPLLLLRRFQDAGHRAVALAGGATGMVGDPSGRSDERNLLDGSTLTLNVDAVAAQLRAFLRFDGGLRPGDEPAVRRQPGMDRRG